MGPAESNGVTCSAARDMLCAAAAAYLQVPTGPCSCAPDGPNRPLPVGPRVSPFLLISKSLLLVPQSRGVTAGRDGSVVSSAAKVYLRAWLFWE